MNRRSYPYKPTAADQLVIRKWKLRLTIVYGVILLALVGVTLVNPGGQRTEQATIPAEHASVTNTHPTR